MKEWLIIDGYNLIHQIFPDDRNGNLACLEKNRKKLLTLLEPLVNVLARKITIVFDGQSDKTQNNQKDSEVIDVLYSPPHLSADTVIENLVWKADRPEDILVVTSDRLERDGASASGADTMASSLFISMIKDEQCRLSSKISQMNKRHENLTLGDFFNFSPDKNDEK